MHRFVRLVALAACGLGLAGCTGTIVTGECDLPAPLPTPAIVGLGGAGATIVDPARFALEIAPPQGAADQLAAGLEVALELEMWTRNPDGSARERVWTASVDAGGRGPVALTQGTFEGVAGFLGGLEPWRDHLVRARYVARDADDCASEGAWSPKVDFKTDDGSLALFDPAVVREYRLELPPETVAAMNAEAEPPGCVPFERSYHPGTLAVDGVTYAGAGVKIKGGCGSSQTLDEKPSLKINLGWDAPAVPGCPAERRLRGLERLTLNNMVQDPSMTHEQLAYTLYARMGVPVPRASYAKVYVNGTYYGLYLHLDTIDRRFLARHFVSNRGQLYEGTYGCDLVSGSIRDDDSGCMTRAFAPDPCDGAPAPGDDPLDYTPIRRLITQLDALPPGGFYPAITRVIDFDTLLSMWAVEAVLAHWDGYVYQVVNNYRLYHDPATDLWTFIPHGLDQALQNRHVDDDPFAVNGRLARRCLDEPSCQAAFAARLRETLDAASELDLPGLRRALAARVTELIGNDGGRQYDAGRTAGEHTATEAFLNRRPTVVRERLSARGL